MNLNPTHNRFAERLQPRDAVLVLVDCQEVLVERLADGKPTSLRNNVMGLARLARAFGLPAVLGALPTRKCGRVLGELVELFGSEAVVERGSGDFWEDSASRKAIRASGRRDVILAALVPGAGVAAPALAALKEGFQVHAVLDASASGDAMVERLGVARMTAGGVRLTTWVAMLAEFTATGAGHGAAAAVRHNLEQYSFGPAGTAALADNPLARFV
jgi:nicotinamidase-related amidase